jgi:signal transduction histidine kinase
MMLHARGSMGQREPINMNYMLDEAFNLVYHGLRAQDSGFNIIVSRDYDPNLGQLVADPQELNRVLLNLINNACFAAYEKSKDGLNGQPEILLSTKDVNDAIEIKIRDNGMGIPAGLQDKIFNPFFTTKPAGKGTGLGLSISYDIICNKYGGNISFESGTGAYTEFLVVLPR